MKGNYVIMVKECMAMLLIVFLTMVCLIISLLMVRVFFSTVLWLMNGGFNMTLDDVYRGVKIGVVGGGISGVGIVLFRLFKVKGF